MDGLISKILPVSDDVDEIQVWYNGMFIGAGAWSRPYDLDTVIRCIQDVWLRK